MEIHHGIERQSRRAILGSLLLIILLAGAFALSALSLRAAPDGGTVGTGTPASCTEAALDARLVGGGSVDFNCGASAYTLTISSPKVIAINTVINGGGKITLNGNNSTKIFVVNAGRSLKLVNITLANGRSQLGGCVLVLGSLTAYDSTFRGCHSVTGFLNGSGGALAAYGTSLTLSNTQILNNIADVDGGGIYLGTGVATMENVSVIGNQANLTYTNSGGGIFVAGGVPLTMTNSQVSNNLFGYTGQGGGIAAYSTTVRLSSVVVNNNHGANAGDGGGLYLQNVTATLASLSISGNDHLYAGGGISAQESRVTLSNSDISGNTASSNGGGITTYKGKLDLSAVSVNGNLVTSDGGGIYLYDTPANLTNVSINNNRGGRNGGGIDHYLNTLTLNNVTLSGNVSNYSGGGDGGGIYNDSGLLVATNSTIDHNVAAQRGGGLFNASDSTSDLSNVTLSANTAITGGGVYNEAGFTQPSVVTLTNITLRDNSATDGGGTYNGVDVHNFFFLKNTIIADSPSGGNCKGKAFTASKYSLATDGTCALAGLGNQNSVPAQLNPLANNGGPTRTHLPKPTSPAVNGVSGSDCPSVDQRGVARPQGPSCDIGAVERQSSDPALSPALWLPLIVR